MITFLTNPVLKKYSVKNHESRHDAYQNRKNELRNAINQVNESNIGLTYQPKVCFSQLIEKA